MSRIPVVELEDQPWLPATLRNYTTDCLRVLFGVFVERTRIPDHLAELLAAAGEDRIVDLCSGGGGPLPRVLRRLEARGLRPRALLSDLYPNLDAFRAVCSASSRVDFLADSVDARDVPPTLPGVRTLFSALHHFSPAEARAILHDAASRGRAVGVFEVAERRIGTFAVLLGLPWAVWAMTPFLRPLRPGRLLLTYVLPVIPLLVLWDGLASCLRSYSLPELRRLVESAGPDDGTYRWTVGQEKLPGLPVRVTYVLGRPTSSGVREGETDGACGSVRPDGPAQRWQPGQ